ncbi:DUF1552 domain-containing protein [Lignipirellula cremea]|uniref:DUF1552 domain-containing protein n=1 Tax=Lignipirellula cremea TaxID=2528010 RepID=A0A518DQC1_9BACT|nr:DUF1552 domain-containing protein [Lignipirellula cremea]QDU94036.1 hypothetical protein Pla8534_18220 [Lignipirellula cremea]
MSITRRKFTRGMALGAGGIAMAPLLHQMEALADGRMERIPKRFVFVIKSSGLTADAIRPEAYRSHDGGLDATLQDCRLPATMASLEAFKDQLLILDGLSGVNFTGNHSSYYGALSCHHAPDKPAAATIDCLLGRMLPAPFHNYGFAPNGHSIGNNFGPLVQETAVFPKISAYGPNKPMAYQASAEKAYRELFGSVADLASGGKKEFALQTNLLDFLAEDVKRVSRNVGPAEREKLDHYLGAFDSVRARNEKLSNMSEAIRRNSPTVTSQYSSKVFAERVSVFFDLGAAALIAGLTNVVSIRADWLSAKYESFGFGGASVHDIGHHKKTANGLASEEARDVIRKFQIDQIAGLAAKLKATPEGDGTMLDNTMIVYLSDGADAHHSVRKNWPFIVVGGRNLGLKSAGRYLRYPDYGLPGHKTIGNWYNTLLTASGSESQETFGQLDGQLRDLDLKGPLSELMG